MFKRKRTFSLRKNKSVKNLVPVVAGIAILGLGNTTAFAEEVKPNETTIVATTDNSSGSEVANTVAEATKEETGETTLKAYDRATNTLTPTTELVSSPLSVDDINNGTKPLGSVDAVADENVLGTEVKSETVDQTEDTRTSGSHIHVSDMTVTVPEKADTTYEYTLDNGKARVAKDGATEMVNRGGEREKQAGEDGEHTVEASVTHTSTGVTDVEVIDSSETKGEKNQIIAYTPKVELVGKEDKAPTKGIEITGYNGVVEQPRYNGGGGHFLYSTLSEDEFEMGKVFSTDLFNMTYNELEKAFKDTESVLTPKAKELYATNEKARQIIDEDLAKLKAELDKVESAFTEFVDKDELLKEIATHRENYYKNLADYIDTLKQHGSGDFSNTEEYPDELFDLELSNRYEIKYIAESFLSRLIANNADASTVDKIISYGTRIGTIFKNFNEINNVNVLSEKELAMSEEEFKILNDKIVTFSNIFMGLRKQAMSIGESLSVLQLAQGKELSTLTFSHFGLPKPSEDSVKIGYVDYQNNFIDFSKVTEGSAEDTANDFLNTLFKRDGEEGYRIRKFKETLKNDTIIRFNKDLTSDEVVLVTPGSEGKIEYMSSMLRNAGVETYTIDALRTAYATSATVLMPRSTATYAPGGAAVATPAETPNYNGYVGITSDQVGDLEDSTTNKYLLMDLGEKPLETMSKLVGKGFFIMPKEFYSEDNAINLIPYTPVMFTNYVAPTAAVYEYGLEVAPEWRQGSVTVEHKAEDGTVLVAKKTVLPEGTAPGTPYLSENLYTLEKDGKNYRFKEMGVGSASAEGVVEDGVVKDVVFVYELIKGTVTVEHRATNGTVLITKEAVYDNVPTGTNYETTHRDEIRTDDGRVFVYKGVALGSADTLGRVTETPADVIYEYAEKTVETTVVENKGNVDVHFYRLIDNAEIKDVEHLIVDGVVSRTTTVVTKLDGVESDKQVTTEPTDLGYDAGDLYYGNLKINHTDGFEYYVEDEPANISGLVEANKTTHVFIPYGFIEKTRSEQHFGEVDVKYVDKDGVELIPSEVVKESTLVSTDNYLIEPTGETKSTDTTDAEYDAEPMKKPTISANGKEYVFKTVSPESVAVNGLIKEGKQTVIYVYAEKTVEEEVVEEKGSVVVEFRRDSDEAELLPSVINVNEAVTKRTTTTITYHDGVEADRKQNVENEDVMYDTSALGVTNATIEYQGFTYNMTRVSGEEQGNVEGGKTLKVIYYYTAQPKMTTVEKTGEVAVRFVDKDGVDIIPEETLVESSVIKRITTTKTPDGSSEDEQVETINYNGQDKFRSEIKVGDKTYVYKAMTPESATETGEVVEGKTTVIYQYAEKTIETREVEETGSVIVHFKEDGTDKELKPTETFIDNKVVSKSIITVTKLDGVETDRKIETTKTGERYDTADLGMANRRISFGGFDYAFVRVVGEENDKIEPNQTMEVTYYYSAEPKVSSEAVKGSVKVRYVDTNGVEIKTEVTGVDEDIVKYINKVEYATKDPETSEELTHNTYDVEDLKDAKIEFDGKTYNFKELATDSAAMTGELKEGETVVTYVYEVEPEKVAGVVTVVHQTKDGLVLIPEENATDSDKVGDTYSVSPHTRWKTADGRIFVYLGKAEESATETGEITVEPKRVIFLYGEETKETTVDEIKGSVVVKYVNDATDEEIKPSETVVEKMVVRRTTMTLTKVDGKVTEQNGTNDDLSVPYDTTGKRLSNQTIMFGGKLYKYVRVVGSEEGSVTEGETVVVYRYKEVTKAPEEPIVPPTPTPTPETPIVSEWIGDDYVDRMEEAYVEETWVDEQEESYVDDDYVRSNEKELELDKPAVNVVKPSEETPVDTPVATPTETPSDTPKQTEVKTPIEDDVEVVEVTNEDVLPNTSSSDDNRGVMSMFAVALGLLGLKSRKKEQD